MGRAAHDRGMALQFETVVAATGPAAAIELTDEHVAELGGGKRAAVRVLVSDRTAKLRLGVMGGRNLIGLSKAARDELGVSIGASVSVTIELDVAERVVEMPDDLTAALAEDSRRRAAFEALSYTQRKEHARSVADAKRPETRARRLAAIVAVLDAGTSAEA